MKNIVLKLKSPSGESIAEVLVALVVAVMGVLLVVGCIVSSTKSMRKANIAMNGYYENVNALEDGSADSSSGRVTIAAGEGDAQAKKTLPITILKVDVFDKTEIYAYKN